MRHGHAVAIAGSKLRHHLPDGQTQDSELEAGAALWTPAVTHRGENLTGVVRGGPSIRDVMV